MNSKIANYLNQLNLDPRRERALINIISENDFYEELANLIG